MSLSSLLHLEDLLRLILLLPQSAKIQEFTKTQLSLKKFSIPECLLGLVTAEDLDLATTGDHILQFINNPSVVGLMKRKWVSGLVVHSTREAASPLERFNIISDMIAKAGESLQNKILKSLDTSFFSKMELLELVRTRIELVERASMTSSGLFIFKDVIKEGIPKGNIFFPQHLSKLD